MSITLPIATAKTLVLGWVVTGVVMLLTFYFNKAQAQNDEIAFRVVAHHVDGRSSVSNEVVAHRPLNLYMPTAFTPDGDGLNDTFVPVGEGIATFQMNIYDRWGNLIFSTDRPEQGWDGTVNGAAGMSGSYAYEITATSHHSGTIQRTGAVSLLLPHL